ncbi:extracellular solute-binding protein [Aliivibrio salmonicida]|uniref:extracellular solute-binding protein n=1 Tax=Aliivibrio salmonicida TaxID=40269 RepID=UPI00406C8828
MTIKKRLALLSASTVVLFSANVFSADLPANLEWQTNDSAPTFASPQATFGGTFRTYTLSFPQTFRTVGPDSNGSFRAWILEASLPPLIKHPNTNEWLPGLAQSWAFGDDNKTVYFKLNPKATWSDGKPVTADDYQFMLKLMRSTDIVAPWYNDFFTNDIADIITFDKNTIAIVSAKARNRDELIAYTNLMPRPKHFYGEPKVDENNDGIDDKFVRKYNFKPEPVTGPYYIDKIKKGKNIAFKHVGKDWWGYENKYNQNRYNVEKINIKVIRDADIALKHFEKGNLDAFDLVRPDLWHEKSDGKNYQNGYIQKAWVYNQTAVGAGGLWLNTAKPMLDDINVRKGIMYATDFDMMIEKVLRGDYSRKPNGMGFGYPGYDNTELTAPKFDAKKSIEYFEKAGFSIIGSDGIRVNDKGERLSFAVTYSQQSFTPRVAVLKEQAKQAGLDLELNLIDGSSMFKYVLEKKHDISFHNMGTSDIPAYWEYFHSDNANKPQTNHFTNFSSAELDSLIDSFKNEFDIDKKQALSREIQQVIADANVIVPGYMVPYARAGYWRWMKLPEQMATKQTGYLFHGWGFSQTFSTFWIDEKAKKETKAAMKSGKTFEPVIIIDETYKL